MNPIPQFKEGDRVTWTHRTQNGNRLGFSTREGKVHQVRENDLLIKGKGRSGLVSKRKTEVRLAGAETELTEAFRQLGS